MILDNCRGVVSVKRHCDGVPFISEKLCYIFCYNPPPAMSYVLSTPLLFYLYFTRAQF